MIYLYSVCQAFCLFLFFSAPFWEYGVVLDITLLFVVELLATLSFLMVVSEFISIF